MFIELYGNEFGFICHMIITQFHNVTNTHNGLTIFIDCLTNKTYKQRSLSKMKYIHSLLTSICECSKQNQ